MPKFGHLANLSAYAYDRGSKIVGMIEERLGETAFLDFMRTVYQKYQLSHPPRRRLSARVGSLYRPILG